MMPNLFEAVGAIHLHSDFSDGALPIPEIAGIAEKKPLDFLMFTDHHTLEPKRRGLEGWYGDVLVLIGYEINDQDDRNHYLAFRLDEEVGDELEAAEYVRRVKKAGGFGVIAHPAEKRNFSDAYPPYPWTAWDVSGFDGIEIWNHLSEWVEGVTRSNFFWRMIHPLSSIRYPAWETLERWDRLNQKQRIVGLGGIDVHGHRIKIFGFIPKEIYPYKVQLRSILTHVFLEQHLKEFGKSSFENAEEMLFQALLAGRCCVVNHRVGDGRGFRFWVEEGGQEHFMGSRLRSKGSCRFYAFSPLEGDIRLLRDGKIVRRSISDRIQYDTDEPGVYRIEIFRKRRGWIYANPIVLTE